MPRNCPRCGIVFDPPEDAPDGIVCGVCSPWENSETVKTRHLEHFWDFVEEHVFEPLEQITPSPAFSKNAIILVEGRQGGIDA